MNEIVIHRKTDTIAILIGENDDPTTANPLATVYRMKDGWHMKVTHRHDRFAWSGPFAAPEDALLRYTPADVTGPIMRIAV
jgi:cobalamin biosynthesis protein CobD/CbiB